MHFYFLSVFFSAWLNRLASGSGWLSGAHLGLSDDLLDIYHIWFLNMWTSTSMSTRKCGHRCCKYVQHAACCKYVQHTWLVYVCFYAVEHRYPLSMSTSYDIASSGSSTTLHLRHRQFRFLLVHLQFSTTSTRCFISMFLMNFLRTGPMLLFCHHVTSCTLTDRRGTVFAG